MGVFFNRSLKQPRNEHEKKKNKIMKSANLEIEIFGSEYGEKLF